jgi:poly-gamma-glutamate capsule biosynthesis protein CapA/YwtB (metallophosphatase superfamily)
VKTIRLALAGDTMLGRGCAEVLAVRPPQALWDPEVVAATREADLFVLNLECAISERGSRWPDPRKPFFFRAPPVAAEGLLHLGVDCVTLANNHALDYGPEALLDTLDLLRAAGIACAGAGRDVDEAREPRFVEADGFRLAVVALSDHPADFAAGPDVPGIAWADLRSGTLPEWVRAAIERARREADAVLCMPHWGPNMTTEPPPYVRAIADQLLAAGATLVAGHSAHVFHGVAGPVLYDLGDFIDDYAVDPRLRNDLGLLFLVDLAPAGPERIEALPLKLDFCHTRPAHGEEADWVRRRFERACAAFGTEVREEGGRLVIEV